MSEGDWDSLPPLVTNLIVESLLVTCKFPKVMSSADHEEAIHQDKESFQALMHTSRELRQSCSERIVKAFVTSPEDLARFPRHSKM